MISKLFIIALIVVSILVLLPDLLARIPRGRRRDTIRSFNRQLSSLGRSAPVSRGDNVIEFRSRSVTPIGATSADEPEPAPLPRPRAARSAAPAAVRNQEVRPQHQVSAAVRKRRQDVLMCLGAAVLLTLLATIAFGGAFLYLQLLADVLFAAYLVALQRAGAAGHATTVSLTARRAQRARSTGALAPLSGSAGRTHTVEPGRIAN